MASTVHSMLRAATPTLGNEIDRLADGWLGDLVSRLKPHSPAPSFRPKQVNDPVWGTIELFPWEVAILDTPLLQRMRGVKQLGLAQLVFPGASHGRLEHAIGVVGAAEEALRALARQIERWKRDHKDEPIPEITEADRYAIRLAALLHDIGHGPFSHAVEPVLSYDAPLGSLPATLPNWRSELRAAQEALKAAYQLNDQPSVSETIAVLLLHSGAMTTVLASDRIFTERGMPVEELLDVLTAAVIGGVEGPGATHLSGLISSQVDADKLDYLARDAHHAGLEIAFDTDRLLARLEVLRVREENLDADALELRKRAARSPGQTFHQLGIAASGFGSFEQMLIGRTFLYDRLYHHHKVRAAEAMAQRLMIVAERDRDKRFEIAEIFLSVDDETMLRIFAQDVIHKELSVPGGSSASIAKDLLNRNLLHRAFAFRGRFIASPAGLSASAAEQNRTMLWARLVRAMDGLARRYQLGEEIWKLAVQCAQAIRRQGVDVSEMDRYVELLERAGPDQVIIDLPSRKAEAIRILARYPNGAIKVPEFSFNPVKWSDAYDLQKRTGYVFCPRGIAPVVGLAAKIVFLASFGMNMAEEADGYIKAAPAKAQWLESLVKESIIDADTAAHLTSQRVSLLRVRAEDLKVPDGWLVDDPDLATTLVVKLQDALGGGLIAAHLSALGQVLEAMFAFLDMWIDTDLLKSEPTKERDVQDELRKFLQARGLAVQEKTKVAGGELDLFVQNAVLVENKFEDSEEAKSPAPAAGMQGRRYAIALSSQVVIVLVAARAMPGAFPSKAKLVEVRPIASGENRVEIRFTLPFGAISPSREKPASASPRTRKGR